MPNISILEFIRSHKVFFLFYVLMLICFFYITQPLNSNIHIQLSLSKKIFFKIYWVQEFLKYKESHSKEQLFTLNTNYRTL